MKNKVKRNILIILLVVTMVIGVVIVWLNISNNSNQEPLEEKETTEKYVQVLEDGTKLNISDKLNQTKKLDGLEITEIQLTHRDGISVVLATVTNTTGSNIDLIPIELTLYDDKNNELERIHGVISPVKAGESVQLNIGVSADYANAYDFKIEKLK